MDLDKLEALAKAATQGPWVFYTPEGAALNPMQATFVVGPTARFMDRSQGFSPEDGAYLASVHPATILALLAEVRALREDKARLDWLDQMNANLNRHYGTTYQWKVILSHNITRLMVGWHRAGFVGDIDLNDAQCGDDSFVSCRGAIDAARGAK